MRGNKIFLIPAVLLFMGALYNASNDKLDPSLMVLRVCLQLIAGTIFACLALTKPPKKL